MRRLLLLAALAGSLHTNAQQVRPATSAEIYHEIAQLQNLTNVLYFAAHPDDENTRLLAWLVNDKHIRTAYLSLTRGDGGQNILGTEQGAALGLIRTHELMAARRLDGAEQYFTRAIDFGFSKNFTETFKHWNEDLLTSDATLVIREYRPDVIICRFPPNENAGHGQHAASAIIAAKAFKAAGDKSQYPDQLKYYAAWQPKRILFNAFRFGDRNTTSEQDFKLAVGQYNAPLGMGIGELAGISRSIHRSQGAGTPSTPGVQTEYFKLVDGEPISASLFDGIDITWGRVQRPEIGKEIEQILGSYDFRQPEKSLPALLTLRKHIETVKDEYWRDQKLKELDAAILHATGLMAEVYAKQPEAVAGSTLPFTLKFIARSGVPVTVNNINWLNTAEAVNISMKGDSLYTMEHNITIPANTAITEPYWLSSPAKDIAHYPIPNDTLRGMPETPNNLNITLSIKVDGTAYDIAVPLSFKKLDPTRGDVVEQLRIVPAYTLDFTSTLIIINGDGVLNTGIPIHANTDIQDGSLRIFDNAKLNKKMGGINLTKGTDTIIPVTIKASELPAPNGNFDVFAQLANKDQNLDRSQHLIQYTHIPTLQYFTPASVKVVHANWKSTAKHIGYIPGAGDLTGDVLRLAGLQVDILSEGDMRADKLKKYDAIITGIRAVNTEKRMTVWMPELFRYVQDGGTLVMQYNTMQDMATTNIGPYPITLSSQRVTEEDAAISFIDPKERLLNYPNKINEADFNNWVQERGLYFPTKWDEHYHPLFSMNDTGEQPLTGGTLYTQYGKGHYIYTPLSFSRQLPAGNKGAIRLMLNMLSVGK